MTRYEATQERIMSRPSHWLVTGAAGFIGSNLVEKLLRLNQRVTGLDNFSLGNRRNLNDVRAAVSESQWKGFRFVEGDIRVPDVCHQACRSVNIVLHQAAIGSVPRSIVDPLESHDSNVTGFLNMLIAAHRTGVSRFVYAGSSAVYGDHPVLPKVEDQIGRPLSPYAATKYMNELYAEVFARCYNLGTIGLRYFNVFGPRQDPNGAYAAVIPKWISSMIRAEPVFINGDGKTARDFCYVDNAVQANLLAGTVEDMGAVNQVYNVAVNATTTLNELFEIIRSHLEPRFPQLRELQPVYHEFRPGDVRYSQADIGKAQQFLGYQPALDARAGLARAIGWYLAKLAPPHAAESAPQERPATLQMR